MMTLNSAYPAALLAIHVLCMVLLDTCSGEVILEVSPYPARIFEGAPPDEPVLTVRGYDNTTGLPVTSFDLVTKTDANFFKIDSEGVIKTSQTINFAVGRKFEFMVRGVVNNQNEYKHVQIIVSAKNQHPPKFSLQTYTFVIYRYGNDTTIGFLNVTDADVEAYNKDVTLYINKTQLTSNYVTIGSDHYIRLTRPVPDQVKALNFTVWAKNSGSPQYTSSAEVIVNIASIREPYIFCISITDYTIKFCWKNPMPNISFSGYLLTVSTGGLSRTIYLPAIDEHLESCYTVNETRIGTFYTFSVVVRSTELRFNQDIKIKYTKAQAAAFPYFKGCETDGFSICNYKDVCNSHGDCVTGDDPTNYTCFCDRGWTGHNCDVQDMCVSSPCLSNQICQFTGHKTYLCRCSDGAYYGPKCEFYNHCLDQPCQNYGTCVPLINGTYRCDCPSTFSGGKCQTGNPCSSSPCISNRGTCQRVSDTEFKCDCLTGYYGDRCERVDACLLEVQPCNYQGTCIPVGDTFTCICPPAATGNRCQDLIPCYVQPCLNGGNCTNGPVTGTYVCQCLPGFYGNECQYKNKCFGVNCNKGKCKLDSQLIPRCECFSGFHGDFCDKFDVCLTSPCKNQGTCTSIGPSANTQSNFTCVCPDGWLGDDCNVSSKCAPDACKNGGTCIDVPNQEFHCNCRDGYYLSDCSAFNPCSQHQCQNGATCRNVSQENMTCECPEDWLGDRCQFPNPCSPGRDPCQNGGECLVVKLQPQKAPNTSTQVPTESYSPKCECQKGYIGKTCQTNDPCKSSPCEHGDCHSDDVDGDDDDDDLPAVADAQYVCSCYQNFTGKQCEVPVESCSNIQCLNGGFCQDGVCECPSSFTGSRCETELAVCTNAVVATGEPCVVDEAMKNLQTLLDDTSEPARLTTLQMVNYTDQLINLYNHTLRDPKYAWTAFRILSNLAQVNVSVCEVAERTSNVSTRLRDFLENYTSEVRLDDVSGQINITSSELQVKAVTVQKVLEASNGTVSFQPYVSDNNTSTEINLEIKIPSDILTNATNETMDTRLQFIGYKRSQLFVPRMGFSPGSLQLNQPVISATVKGREIRNLSQPVEIRLFNTTAGRNYTCVFWDTDASRWSSEGLAMLSHDTEAITCTSTHLTSFAILLNVNEEQSIAQEHELILTYLTYIGCAISTSCLVFTIITYAMFKCLNNEKSGKILLQLCAALLLLNVTFLAATVDVSNFSEEACLTVGMLLHYFVLASLMWMLAEAVEMYQALVTVFTKYERLYLAKRCLLAWGIPVIIVAITAGVDSESYYGEKDRKHFCFLTSRSTVAYYTALVGPACAILLVNIFVFIMVARVILKPNFQQQLLKNTASITPAQIRGAFTVMFLLGITWVFGPLAINEAQTAFSYLFCICNSLQGFLIFVFRCLFNPEAKLAWLQLFYTGTLKRTRGPIKSVYTDSTSKGGDNRRASTSNTSGFLGSGTTKSTSSKSGNGFHPHPHQLHNTNGWHPNLNGLKRDRTQKEGSGSFGSIDYSSFQDKKRKLSSEYSPTTKRQSLPNDSTESLQDEQTHF